MSKLKKIPYKFVHVIWIDIVSDSAWRSIDEVKESKCPTLVFAGEAYSTEYGGFTHGAYVNAEKVSKMLLSLK